MIKRKNKSKSISDKILELLVPKPLQDPEVDSADETVAQTRSYDEDERDYKIETRLSDIRKTNVKLLHDVDKKYHGKISSRKELESPESSADSEADAGVDGIKYEQSSEDDEPVQPFSMRIKHFDSDSDVEVKNNSSNESSGVENNEYIDNETEDLENLNDESCSDKFSENNETGTDAEEEEEVDEEESDFDGGDIIHKEIVQEEPLTLKELNINTDVQKGVSVQNQLKIWENLLEMRIHSQKIINKANQLPRYDKFQALKNHDNSFTELAQKTTDNVENLLNKMCEIQKILVNQYPETKDISSKNKRKSSDACEENDSSSKRCKYLENLSNDFRNYKDYRNSIITKWYERTKVLTPGAKSNKLNVKSLDIIQNIEGILINKEELIKKTQLVQGATTPKVGLTDDAKYNESDEQKAENQIYSTEIYNDTDFYHTQLRELIEFKTNTSSSTTEITKQFIELQKLRNKMKKVVDTRASKGRKIRYAVHNKMINFMARNDTSEWTDEAKNELFSSLFGARM